jgi:protein SCO1/2
VSRPIGGDVREGRGETSLCALFSSGLKFLTASASIISEIEIVFSRPSTLRHRNLQGSALPVAFAALMLFAWGCRRFAIFSSAPAPDCLPSMTLTNQNGQKVSLASLKGKPVLFDFIYTRCPGPCLLITARMKAIADVLGTKLGAEISFVSVSVDPEHDTPGDLLNYEREQGIKNPAWLFLTGPPARIDDLMNRFKLTRVREPNGAVDHVLEFFLVGPDGRMVAQYVAIDANAAKIASDLEQVAAGHQLALKRTSDAGRRV